jgi:hypothetical protein
VVTEELAQSRYSQFALRLVEPLRGRSVNSVRGNLVPVRIATAYGSLRIDRSAPATPTRSSFSSDSVPHRNQSASMAEGLPCGSVIRWR